MADSSYGAAFLTQLMTQVHGLKKNPLSASETYTARQFQISNDPVLYDQVI